MNDATRASGAGPTAREREIYDELCFYTLAHGGPEFIHQHVVDAWAVQYADERTKPIGLTFGLVGLYLHLEKGFTGRQVQLAHMKLGKRKHVWPTFVLPDGRGSVTAADVMAVPAGVERDRAIDAWCASVWEAFQSNRETVATLLAEHGVV